MNFINCQNNLSSEIMIKSVAFWSENSFQHIDSLLKSTNGTTAVLQPFFKEELLNLYEEFKKINQMYKQNNPRLIPKPAVFFKINLRFINLLERIKFEGFSGYPILQQSIFHYIYEQRYINAVFAVNNPVGNVLITEYFYPFQNNVYSCIYNQMYFWCIIGSMHPSLLMGNNVFYNSINGYSKEFLTNVCNSFNEIAFKLSQMKKPIKKVKLSEIFAEFEKLNSAFLEFLKLVKANNPRIFINVQNLRLSESFYAAVSHMIGEHTLVDEINKGLNIK